MSRKPLRSPVPALACLLAFLEATPTRAADAPGYTFQRLVIWADPGHPPPRLVQDSGTGRFSLLLPPPPPGSGWEPVAVPRLELRKGTFLAAAPATLARPRDPDPDWALDSSATSLDVNLDGRAEIARARNVVVPDGRDPGAGARRVLVEIREGDRIVFGDLLDGPRGGPVRIQSLSALDFTGEGYLDLVARLKADDRTGIAFYSQAPLRSAGQPTRIIPGFSTDFRPDRYGIFDLNRKPREFFSRLPPNARSERPGCGQKRREAVTAPPATCRFLFSSPYLGWIQEFRVAFRPDERIVSFELTFPDPASPLTPAQALDFLTPVLGGGFEVRSKKEEKQERRVWIWESDRARTRLVGTLDERGDRAISLTLERK